MSKYSLTGDAVTALFVKTPSARDGEKELNENESRVMKRLEKSLKYASSQLLFSSPSLPSLQSKIEECSPVKSFVVCLDRMKTIGLKFLVIVDGGIRN